MKVLIFILALLKPIPEDQKTAIQYYNELQFRCVPKTLKDSTTKVVYKDSVYVMKYDMNDIPWVIKNPVAN
jgi:hypothetical protein